MTHINQAEMMNPLGEMDVVEIYPKVLDRLAGKKVALLDAHKVNSDVFLKRTEELLEEKAGVSGFVRYRKINPGKPTDDTRLVEMAQGADAAIVAFGD